ncbi:hypothetical protein, unknown function [Leishmania tarentolae]|uniref:Uncharacterized protein n=1 Tax=Leishmania tarentolae TaxID=5689 RepID=A0A640KE09_LEITA|nr:hypothetical protein, unknown function [Leishmania tarentolae]
MPIIKSRVHAEELHAVKDALATARREADALRQQVLEQREQLGEHAQENARLAAELVQTETMLEEAHRQMAEMQAHAHVREAHHREQMHRMGQNVRTLEEMIQASRRSEREGSHLRNYRGLNTDTASTDVAGPSGRRAELTHDVTPPSYGRAALQRPPIVPTMGGKTVREQHGSPSSPSSAVSPPTSAQTLYWQEQLLTFSQLAAKGFGEVQQQLRCCLSPSPPRTLPAAVASEAHPGQEPRTTTASPRTDAYRWSQQLRRLQADFDKVVQADAKLISFLLLAVQQQSQQVRTLQQQWAEAQRTVREAEAVLDEANARVTSSAQESAVLRQECAALTEMQTALQVQLTSRTREHQATLAALQRLQEAHVQLTDAHTRQEEMWTTRLTQADELQQQASNYAQKLEAALLDKERLMSAAATMTQHRRRLDVLETVKRPVDAFLKQLNASAQQLQSSLASLSPSTPSCLLAAAAVAEGDVQAPPTTSPGPSPPGASSSAYSASRSPSAPPFRESALLSESCAATLM